MPIMGPASAMWLLFPLAGKRERGR